MQIRRSSIWISLACVLILLLAFSTLRAQSFGNSISGRVTLERRPLADVYVELLDEFGRTIGRVRTNGAGIYTFSGLIGGRYVVRVLTDGLNYQDQENNVEIYNLNPQSLSHEQSDFLLKAKKGEATVSPGSIFVQDVPAEAKSLYEKALKELSTGQAGEGHASLRKAIEIFPKYFDALERLGTEYIQMSQTDAKRAGEIILRVAIEVNPRAFNSWYGLAHAQLALGFFSEGLSSIQKAVELQPESPKAVFLSGILMRHNSKFAESEKLLRKAMELSHDSLFQVHWELALLYGNHMKRYSEAAKELKLFLKAQPNAKDAERIKLLIADFESKAAAK